MTFRRLASPATVAFAAAAVLALPPTTLADDAPASGPAPTAPAVTTTEPAPAPTDATAATPAAGGAAATPTPGTPTVPAASAPPPSVPTAGLAVLSVEQNETPVDGWGGWLVWSRRGADGSFQLIARTPEGVGISLPVAPQPTPIDASIGPGPDGGPLIVYSRCSTVSARSSTGCDVYRIDPRSGAGGPVPSASSPGVDERYPAVWGNTIVFSRTVSGSRPDRQGIAVATLDGPAPKKATIFGPRRERRGRRMVPITSYGPSGIDLRGTTVAYAWHTVGATDRWRLVLNRRAGTGRTLLTTMTTRRTITALGRPALAARNVVVPVLRTGGSGRSEVLRTSYSGTNTVSLRGGFSAAQTERYGSALTAVARPTDDALVVLRRLASDGRWSCKLPAAPTVRGCEILQLTGAAQSWLPASRR